MLTTYGKSLGFNKVEAIVLILIVLILILVATAHIIFVANTLGIHLPSHKIEKISQYMGAGSTLGDAFVAILGIAVPGWLETAALAMGATAA